MGLLNDSWPLLEMIKNWSRFLSDILSFFEIFLKEIFF